MDSLDSVATTPPIHNLDFFFKHTVESIRDGLLVMDGDGRMVISNDQFRTMWQLAAYPLNEPVETHLLPQMLERVINTDAVMTNLLRGFVADGLVTLRLRDGRLFDWQVFPLMCGGTLCGCIWRFTDTTWQHLENRREERAMQSRIAISALLETSLESLSLTRQLEVALTIILTVPWISIHRKGAIFLWDQSRGELVLHVHKGLAPALLYSCARIPLGKCLCGLAAQGRQIIHADCLDERHEIRYAGITEHGHYCVPIHAPSGLLGVLNLYIAEGHPFDPEEEAFLVTVSNILASLIELRQIQHRLTEEMEFSAAILLTAPALVTVTDAQGSILLFNQACQKKTGVSEAHARGRKIWEFSSNPEDMEELRRFFNTLATGSAGRHDTCRLEHSWLCVSNRECIIEWHLVTTNHADGSVRNVIAAGIDVTHRKDMEKLLQHMAGHDPLTGLANRRMFGEHLAKAMAYAQRDKKRLAVMFLDLDHFKEVNDRFGHETGDWLLKEAATRIQKEIRRSDTMARLGGDEFTLVVSNVETMEEPAIVARKIIESLAQPFLFQEIRCTIGVSIGISLYPDHGQEVETLLRQADQAMYLAKEQGRNRFVIYTENAQSSPS